MTWIADLLPFGNDPDTRAVGWLVRGTSYPSGEVSAEWFEALCRLLQSPWSPAASLGFHACDLCQFTGGSQTARYGDYTISGWSSSELYVPGDGCLYVAPVSIAHYIDAHFYFPPEDFCRAVWNCPPMRSVAYFRALLANGGLGLVRGDAGEQP